MCVEGKTGKHLWTRNILDDAAAKIVSWGVTSSPLVVDGLVIVNAGIDPKANAQARRSSYRAKDGAIAWASGSHPAAYSARCWSPPWRAGVKSSPDDAGVGGYGLEAGRELWRFLALDHGRER